MSTEEIQLKEYIHELSLTHIKFTDLGGDIMEANDQKLYAIDFLALAVINRSIQLTEGFVTLIETNNYLCAIPLIRLQLDSALRFFATSLVKDVNDFILYILDGQILGHYKSVVGKKLSDRYLVEQLDAIFPGVRKLYSIISSHIHLSDQHIYATKLFNKDKTNPTTIAIGKDVDPFDLMLKVDFVYTMIEVSKLVFIVVSQWKLEKQALSNINPTNSR